MLKFLLPLLVVYSLSTASACSIGINEQNITNTMVAKAANEFNINLAKTKKIKKEDFSYQLNGEDPNTLCPLTVEVQAKITISYNENLTTQCELSVTVKETADESLGYLTYDFLMPASSCTYTPLRIRRGRIGRIK